MTTITYLLFTLLTLNIIFLTYQFLRRRESGNGEGGEQNIPFAGLIPLKWALDIIGNYMERRKRHTDLLPEHRKENMDTESVFLSLNNIKGYIQYVEKRAKEKNININGLRIYFAAYPNKAARMAHLTGEDDKQGYQTLVIFPTTNDNFEAIDIERSTSKNDLFFIKEALKTNHMKNKAVEESEAGNPKNFIMASHGAVGSDESSAYNDMNSSPPRQH